MPIWLRRFTYSKIAEFYEKQREAQEEAANKAQGIQKATPQNTMGSNSAPTYSTKVSKK